MNTLVFVCPAYAWHSALADRHPDPHYHSALAVRRIALGHARPGPYRAPGNLAKPLAAPHRSVRLDLMLQDPGKR
jgi:hypothetical protein